MMRLLTLLCLAMAVMAQEEEAKPPTYKSLGCFRDAGRRDLPLLVEVKATTIYRCRDRCRKLLYRYAGVQGSNYCFCGNRYGRYGEAEKSSCNYPCNANKDELCGGAWHNEVYSTGVGRAALEIRPLGCFKDEGTRDLPVLSSGTADVNSCLLRCRKLGYKYAGVQVGSQCWCGNSYGRYGKKPDAECATPCSANHLQICGGPGHNLVYETGFKPQEKNSLGCYVEGGGRDLPETLNGLMSVDKCIDYCSKFDFKYAGVQYSSYCFCGNSYGRFGKAPSEANCNMACNGNKDQICGAGWRNNIYATGRSREFTSLGCYIDQGTRDLPFFAKSGVISLNNCRYECASHGFLYFAVQNSNACFCGNKYGRYGKAPDSACDKKCTGDRDQNCGGYYRNHVYATDVRPHNGNVELVHEAQSASDEHERSLEQSVSSDRTGKLVDISQMKMRKFGCFRDAGERDLPQMPYNGVLDVHYCRWTCRQLRYRYFGLQATTQCFCGNHFGKYGQGDDSKCNYKCGANQDQICGGSWYNTLYATDITKEQSHYKPLGCYVDQGTRDLPQLGSHCPIISVNTCVKSCRDLGFKYAGAQNGAWCYCGNTYGRYGKAKASECYVRCHANQRQICGGPLRNHIYETHADITNPDNLGCYEDKGVHDLVEMPLAGVMSINYCRKLCRELGYKYAGVQVGSQCWCGNSYGRYGKLDASRCNSKCTGHNEQICGGVWANNIYESGRPEFVFKSMGCYNDKAVRDLPFLAKIGSITLNNCRQLCWRYGYKYFGVQNSNMCHCGDSYNKYGRVEDVRCAKPCLGNKAQTCGDYWLNNIYETGVGNDDETHYTEQEVEQPTEAPKPEPKPEPTEAPQPEPTQAPKPEPEVIDGDKDEGGSSATKETTEEKVVRKGCFHHGSELTDLVFTGAVTIQKCANMCARRYYRYAGLKGGTQCFCGNGYGKAGASSDCNLRCRGNRQQVCGGKTAVTVYTTIVYWKFVSRGCFVDKAARDLPRLSMSGAISVNRCFRHCSQLGFYYAGVQDGMQCFCGNSYGRYGKADAGKCDKRCRGNKAQICGGHWYQNIYRTDFTKTSHTAIGCYKDSQDHDLPDLVKEGQMTVNLCLRECSRLSYKYAGLQNGNRCYCGNSYGRYGKGEAAVCTTVCSANSDQMCGGAEYNLIFETGVQTEFTSLGCYKDDQKRDLPYLAMKSSKVNLNRCRSECRDYGFLYFGVQTGNECRCGNAYGKYGEAQGECTVKCSGNGAQICGGEDYRQSVYSTGLNYETVIISEGVDQKETVNGNENEICGGDISTITGGNSTISYRYLWTIITYTDLMHLSFGCFKDAATERDLATEAGSGDSMTVSSCVKVCQDKKFKFAGLQNGKECYCGNQFGRYGSSDDKYCSKPCSGDVQVMCGGEWYNSVYSTTLEDLPDIVTYIAEKPRTSTTTTTTITYYDENGNPIRSSTSESTNEEPME